MINAHPRVTITPHQNTDSLCKPPKSNFCPRPNKNAMEQIKDKEMLQFCVTIYFPNIRHCSHWPQYVHTCIIQQQILHLSVFLSVVVVAWPLQLCKQSCVTQPISLGSPDCKRVLFYLRWLVLCTATTLDYTTHKEVDTDHVRLRVTRANTNTTTKSLSPPQ